MTLIRMMDEYVQSYIDQLEKKFLTHRNIFKGLF